MIDFTKPCRYAGPNVETVEHLRKMSKLVRMRFAEGVTAKELENLQRLCRIARRDFDAPFTSEN